MAHDAYQGKASCAHEKPPVPSPCVEPAETQDNCHRVADQAPVVFISSELQLQPPDVHTLSTCSRVLRTCGCRSGVSPSLPPTSRLTSSVFTDSTRVYGLGFGVGFSLGLNPTYVCEKARRASSDSARVRYAIIPSSTTNGPVCGLGLRVEGLGFFGVWVEV